MEKVIYIGQKGQALIGAANLYLNDEGVIEVEKGSKEDILCKSYNLQNLEELYKKYSPEPRGEKKKKTKKK